MVRSKGEISAKFDAIFSNNVIEHFLDPVAQFNEFRTYLKPVANSLILRLLRIRL